MNKRFELKVAMFNLVFVLAMAPPPMAVAAEKPALTPDTGNPTKNLRKPITKKKCIRSPISSSATGISGTANSIARLYWAAAVSHRYGNGYSKWENAKNKRVTCESAGTAQNNAGQTFSGQTCTATAIPCKVLFTTR